MRTRNLLPALLLGVALVGLTVSHLPAADPADADKIKKLVEQLGADSYAERQAASDALAKIGAPALEALRGAAKSTDAEVRKRSTELLARIEKLAESKLILDPKMVHLTYKDTPLKDAAADFSKKSGYDLVLHDPEKKLKDVKVTLDTGKVTFWSALAKFGDAAGVHDGDPNTVPAAGGARPVGPAGAAPAAKPAAGAAIDKEEVKAPALAPVRAGAVLFVKDIRFAGGGGGPRLAGLNNTWVLTQPGQIFLLPGKPAKVSADTTTAIRVRPADRKRYSLPVGEKEIALVLEMATEPKVRWQTVLGTQIEKAIDDQDQKLKAAEEARQEVPIAAGRAGVRALPLPPPAMPGGAPMMWFPASANGVYHFASLRLKKGEKESKTLKELVGTISGQALTESEELLVVDQVLKAAGKEVKGKGSGSIQVTAVAKQPDGSTQITFEFESPDGVIPDTVLRQPVAAAAVGRPETRPMAGGVGGPPMGLGRPGTFAPYGLRLLDEKGKVVLSSILVNWKRGLGVGAAARKMEFNATYKDVKAEPAKLVFMGRRQVAVTVPFTLKDVEVK